MIKRAILIVVSVYLGIIVALLINQQITLNRSILYGYFLENVDIPLAEYGKRSSDIVALLHENVNATANVKSATTQHPYTIVVLGDSYVWGMGIRDSERFTNLLQNRLNGMRPVKVISLGYPGDSILDNYVKYRVYTKNNVADMVIFASVDNDLLYREKSQYDQNIQNNILDGCTAPLIWNVESPSFTGAVYDATKKQTYQSSYGNLCVLDAILQAIPKKTNIFFFNFGYNWGKNYLIDMFMNEVTKNGFPVISVPPQKEATDLYVSAADPHPSAYANRLFADILFNAVTKSWQTGE